MRPSVTAAWPAFCRSYEGSVNFLYFDTKNLATTGTGNMIDAGGHLSDFGASLPWRTKTGALASGDAIAHEYTRLKALGIYRQGGYAYQRHATLFLDQTTVDSLLITKTAEFWAILRSQLPGLDGWPADAQLALMDMGWHMGPRFLGSRWPNFTAAAKAGNFAGMSRYCPTAAHTPRDTRHVQLYLNAASVVVLNVDPDILWLDRAPVKPDPLNYDLEAEIMAMTPDQRTAFANEIADAILARDAVPNTFTGNPKNETVALKTALKSIGDSLTKLKTKLGVK